MHKIVDDPDGGAESLHVADLCWTRSCSEDVESTISLAVNGFYSHGTGSLGNGGRLRSSLIWSATELL